MDADGVSHPYRYDFFTVHTRLCTQTGTDSACVFLPCALHSAHADFPDAAQRKQQNAAQHSIHGDTL